MPIVSTRKSGDVTILDLNGKITIGVGDYALREAVHEALEGGAKKILLNLAGVTTLDSTGLGELVGSHTRASNQGAKLKLALLPPKVHDLLIITRLITVFEVYETEDEAIKSFA